MSNWPPRHPDDEEDSTEEDAKRWKEEDAYDPPDYNCYEVFAGGNVELSAERGATELNLMCLLCAHIDTIQLPYTQVWYVCPNPECKELYSLHELKERKEW